MTRRSLLRGASLGLLGTAGAAILAACGETQVIEKIVTHEVVREVPVETVVTKEVIREIPVEKVVTKEVTVEKVVEVMSEREKRIESAEMGIPVSGGTLRTGYTPPAKPVINPYVLLSNTVYTKSHTWMSLWNGIDWGEGRTPNLGNPAGPGVANRWDEIEPNRVWNFHINPDATWHDGMPTTADDVVFGLHMATHPEWGFQHAGRASFRSIQGLRAWQENPTDNIEDSGGITKIDEMTVQLALEAPELRWLESHQWDDRVFPMPKHIYGSMQPGQEAILESEYALAPVGNGPMKHIRMVEGQFSELVSFKEFPYGTPYIDGMTVRYGDIASRDAAMAGGELDMHRTGSVENFKSLIRPPHVRGSTQLRNLGTLMFVNRKTVDNAELVTEAMLRAIDREAIVADVLSNTANASWYLFDALSVRAGGPPDAAVRDFSYNPDAARALLEEAGYDFSRTLKWLWWSTPNPAMLAIQQYLADAGMNVEFNIIQIAAVRDVLYVDNEFDLVMANFGGGPMLPGMWQQNRCGASIDNGGFNHSSICDPEVDALYEKGIAAATVEELTEIWDELDILIHSKGHLPAAQLWYLSLLNTYHARVRDVDWMNLYYIQVQAPIWRLWLDPRWDAIIGESSA